MFFSNKEKEIMEKLFLSASSNQNEIYTLTFPSGDIIEAQIDTCYETDNDGTDDEYEEYYACAMRVLKVIKSISQSFSRGDLIEVNYHNYPKEIKNSHGEKL